VGVSVSCIVALRDEGGMAGPALAALLAQTQPAQDIVVILDGADAATAQAADAIRDPRIRVVERSRDGLSSAFNHGVELARGDWLTFQTGHDLRPAHALAALAAQGERADLVLAPVVREGETPAAEFAALDALLPEGGAIAAGDTAFARALGAAAALPLAPAGLMIRRETARGLRFPDGVCFGEVFLHLAALARAGRVALMPGAAALRPRHLYTARSESMDGIAILSLALEALAGEPRLQHGAFRTGCVARLMRLLGACAARLGPVARREFLQVAGAVVAAAPPLWDALPEDGGGLCPPAAMARFLAMRHGGSAA